MACVHRIRLFALFHYAIFALIPSLLFLWFCRKIHAICTNMIHSEIQTKSFASKMRAVFVKHFFFRQRTIFICSYTLYSAKTRKKASCSLGNALYHMLDNLTIKWREKAYTLCDRASMYKNGIIHDRRPKF